ncbi:hypothetical protein LPU83_pLPU83d_0627 (plasmid) [Rhizobium favelukesii]|uniref:Uncharacterized protein n=1 Tax=Rhizobium favelukesii TaxID=348824 RepID=W6RTB9_9HYPH|nr:hypothetical protein LPU83_pLPU83d_0627 [Rhizobium favelukesii]
MRTTKITRAMDQSRGDADRRPFTYLTRFPNEKVCENRFPNLLELGVLFSNLGLEDEGLGDFRGRDGLPAARSVRRTHPLLGIERSYLLTSEDSGGSCDLIAEIWAVPVRVQSWHRAR